MVRLQDPSSALAPLSTKESGLTRTRRQEKRAYNLTSVAVHQGFIRRSHKYYLAWPGQTLLWISLFISKYLPHVHSRWTPDAPTCRSELGYRERSLAERRSPLHDDGDCNRPLGLCSMPTSLLHPLSSIHSTPGTRCLLKAARV
jgi:hypothetical protein